MDRQVSETDLILTFATGVITFVSLGVSITAIIISRSANKTIIQAIELLETEDDPNE